MSHAIISHYNQRNEASREERLNSQSFALKVANNLMKRILISEAVNRFDESQYPSLVVVDLCGGKAGDLRKWVHSKRDLKYYLIDASPIEVERAEKRFNELKPEEKACFKVAKFICADAFSKDLFEKVSELKGQANIISCQFAIHYAYESETKSNQFWSIIEWFSQNNTVFAVSHPLRQRIIEWCRAYSRKRKGVYDENQLCSISFSDPQMEQLVANSSTCEEAMQLAPQCGACYRFTLNDALYQVPEFLTPNCGYLHRQAQIMANMRCDFNARIDSKLTVHSKGAKDALLEMKSLSISTEQYQVACLYQYSLYVCTKKSNAKPEEKEEEIINLAAAHNEPSNDSVSVSVKEVVEAEKNTEPEKKKKKKVTVEPRRSSRLQK